MMKQIVSKIHRPGIALCALLVLLLTTFSPGESWASPPQVGAKMEAKEMVSNIHWLGHDSFRIEGDGIVIYFDPWKI